MLLKGLLKMRQDQENLIAWLGRKNWNVLLTILHLNILKILGYVINIIAVYQLEAISPLRGKASPDHAVMLPG